jgi:hypothetical protein
VLGGLLLDHPDIGTVKMPEKKVSNPHPAKVQLYRVRRTSVHTLMLFKKPLAYVQSTLLSTSSSCYVESSIFTQLVRFFELNPHISVSKHSLQGSSMLGFLPKRVKNQIVCAEC